MTDLSAVWVLDSSAILDWEHWHPQQYLPTFWGFLTQRAVAGQLVIPVAVRGELRGDTGVVGWFSRLPSTTFWSPDTDDLLHIANVAKLFPALKATPARPGRADAQVIQAARGLNAAVICSERTSTIAVTGQGPFAKSQKMDAACAYYGVPCYSGNQTLRDVLASLGASSE